MDELERLRKLARVNTDTPAFSYQYSRNQRQEYIKKNNIKPGTPEWFKVSFAKPELTGETPW
jgi:hypothetical protein